MPRSQLTPLKVWWDLRGQTVVCTHPGTTSFTGKDLGAAAENSPSAKPPGPSRSLKPHTLRTKGAFPRSQAACAGRLIIIQVQINRAG